MLHGETTHTVIHWLTTEGQAHLHVLSRTTKEIFGSCFQNNWSANASERPSQSQRLFIIIFIDCILHCKVTTIIHSANRLQYDVHEVGLMRNPFIKGLM